MSNPKIRFWSTVEGVEITEPILPASKAMPEWFKQVPPNKNNLTYEIQEYKGSVKTCPGLVDYFTRGYVMTMWCDLKIEVTQNGWRYRTPNKEFTIEHHTNEQYINFLPENAKKDNKIILKAVAPWKCKLSKGYSLQQTPLYYHFNEVFSTIPGILDCDIYHTLNIHLAIKEYGEFFIPKGTPLVHYIPFKREDFDFKIIKNDEKTKHWSKSAENAVTSKFYGGYKEYKKNISKCPFHQKDEEDL